MNMIIMSKVVKLKYVVENAKRYMSSKSAKALQSNAANVKDCTKHDTTNAQLE